MAVLENGEIFAGILYKRGKYNRNFKERYFMINRKLQIMEYYASNSKNKSSSLGCIDLVLVQNISVKTTDVNFDNDALPEYINFDLSATTKKSFIFQLTTSDRVWTLASINEIELYKWLQYLSICVYGSIIKEAYVKRQEGATAVSKKWKRRYAVLNEHGQLKWYKHKDRKKYLGFIALDTLSTISNGKIIASDLGFILDLYTKYGNVWYIGCESENERSEWNNHLTNALMAIQKEEEKRSGDLFENDFEFEEKCECISKCLSVNRIIKCLHVFNGNLEEMEINKILAKNTHFVKDYQHLMSVHLDQRNEFENLYNYVAKKIRLVEMEKNYDLRLPKDSQQHTFYMNAIDIVSCTLVCKSWSIHLSKIKPLKRVHIDDNDDEKGYIPLPQYGKSNVIRIQRSQLSLVIVCLLCYSSMQSINSLQNDTHRPVQVKKVGRASSKNKIISDQQMNTPNTSNTFNEQSMARSKKRRIHRRRVKPSDFLKHSLDRAFWRLDQDTLDKMIASGNSPHTSSNDIKITNFNDLLTEKEKKYIAQSNHNNAQKRQSFTVRRASSFVQHKMSDYVPKNNQLLHTPQFSEAHRSKSDAISIPKQQRKNATLHNSNSLSVKHKNNVNDLMASSVKWQPKYPLHLLKNDESYQRHDDYKKNKKRFQKLHKHNLQKQSDTDSFSSMDDSDCSITYPQKPKLPNKKIKTYPFSRSLTAQKLKTKSATNPLLAKSKSRNNVLRSMYLSSMNHDSSLTEEDNVKLDEMIHSAAGPIKDISFLPSSSHGINGNDENETIIIADIEMDGDSQNVDDDFIGSNLSKSLMFKQNMDMNASNFNNIPTASSLLLNSKQHKVELVETSQIRRHSFSQSKGSKSGYSIKRVDNKYENVLKRKRKRRKDSFMHYESDSCSLYTDESVKNNGFWSNLYNYFIGDNSLRATEEQTMISSHSNIPSITCPNITPSITENTPSNILTSPLLLDDNENIRSYEIDKSETVRINFWQIVIENWKILHQTSVVRLFWERDGIPCSCRGQIWYFAIGNALNVSLSSFDSIYRVTTKQMEEYNAICDEAMNEDNVQNDDGSSIHCKSIMGGKNISTRSILNDTINNNEKAQFCEGLKRRKSIERDLSRLFDCESFEDVLDAKHEDIAGVLMAFCNCKESISYIQFMTHLTQILLHYQSPNMAFVSLINMMNAEIFQIYIHCNVAEIRQRIEIFTKMLVYNQSDIARHLQKLSILADTYVMDWCQGLFAAQLPLNIVSRIWDLWFLMGEIIIWKASVALLIILNEHLDICNLSHHKIVKILQSIKKSLKNHNIELSETKFVKMIFSIRLPRDVRKWFKRKELKKEREIRKRKKKRLQRMHHKRSVND